jgi:gluconate kinase
VAALIQQVDCSSVNRATRRQIRDREPVAKNYLKSVDKRIFQSTGRRALHLAEAVVLATKSLDPVLNSYRTPF